MNWLGNLWRRIQAADSDVTIFCECNDVDCLAFVPIEEQTYLDIRARLPTAVVVLPGHEDATDAVLERHKGYLIVQGQ